MEFEISLENLLFYSYHGVLPQERATGNEFLVSLSVFLPIDEEGWTDDLEKTVSYADLFEIVKAEMSNPRDLLETVAFSIAVKIKETYPVITRGRIKIEKKRPPIPEMLGSASVTLSF